MPRGESVTPELGFDILQMLPQGSMLTINNVTLIYHTVQYNERRSTYRPQIYLKRKQQVSDGIFLPQILEDQYLNIHKTGISMYPVSCNR